MRTFVDAFKRKKKFYFAFKNNGGSTWQQLVSVGEACLNYISQGSCEATSVNDTCVYTSMQSATPFSSRQARWWEGRKGREVSGGRGGGI